MLLLLFPKLMLGWDLPYCPYTSTGSFTSDLVYNAYISHLSR